MNLYEAGFRVLLRCQRRMFKEVTAYRYADSRVHPAGEVPFVAGLSSSASAVGAQRHGGQALKISVLHLHEKINLLMDPVYTRIA